MSTIDLAYYFFITGFFTSLIFGVILVVVLSWEARFKDLEKHFTKENVNSKHPVLKWIIILGNSLIFSGVAIFIWGKINGQY
tara:strand:- start:632 stop:877 length:246 start_codon:yes stop_codon:yes gene_type:complete